MSTTPTIPKTNELGLMVLQTQRGLEQRDVTVIEVSADETVITVRYPLNPGLGSTGFATTKLVKQYNTNIWYKSNHVNDHTTANEYVVFGPEAKQERLRLNIMKNSNPLDLKIFKGAF